MFGGGGDWGAGQKHSLHRPLAGKADPPPAHRPNNLIKAGLGQKVTLTLHSAHLSPLFFFLSFVMK